MKIKKIDADLSATQVEALLDATTKEQIKEVNWPEEYPDLPHVSFTLAHDGDNIYIKYWVEEQASLARITQDYGDVYTDSCVEFFISFGSEGYYNIEFNAIGYGLMSHKIRREDTEWAPKELLSSIERYPSLPRKEFEETHLDNWSLMLKLPKEIFFKENLTTLNGVEAKANFYKCGDNLKTPHFVSWGKIEAEAPNFHLPAFFKAISFEK
ncbi:MAG: carbohydrate-binding family 9-like protein [Rikenellaceae bacterium]